MDLSRTVRLSGLTAGAKLDLVQASRSPSVVTIALQLPTSDLDPSSAGSAQFRLTDKFPSNTPIWQLLRRFESGVAGSTSATYNFTQRASPAMDNEASATGSGRLCYTMPVVNIMGRELASFTDLQKTLAQLGLNGGSALLRLTFRNTMQPLEEAMAVISTYFADTQPVVVTPPAAGEKTTAASLVAAAGINTSVVSEPAPAADARVSDLPRMDDADISMLDATISRSPKEIPTSQESLASAPSSTISVFSPPTSATPAAALLPIDEADYTPTIEHASLHQSRLNALSRPQRLPSDKEIAAAQQSRAAARANIQEVVVRLRFPDQSLVQRHFGRLSTVADLHAMVAQVMREPAADFVVLKGSGEQGTLQELAESSREKLIRDLGWVGRVLVTVAWKRDTPEGIRKGPVLKAEYMAAAVEMPTVQMPKDEVAERETASHDAEKKGKSIAHDGKDKESRMRKFLGGLSKR